MGFHSGKRQSERGSSLNFFNSVKGFDLIELELFFEDGTRRRGKFETPVVMGRAPECGIQVSHWRIARQHLRISSAEDGFHVDDLGSILGTRVNGVRITRYGPMKKADEIVAGPCLLRLASTVTQKPALSVVCSEGTPVELQRIEQQAKARVSASVISAPSAMAYQEIRQELRAGLIKAFDLRRHDVAALSEVALKTHAQTCVAELLDPHSTKLSQAERQQVIKLVVDEAIGLGVIEDLLKDSTVTEIMVNRFDEIYVEIEGRLQRHELQFSSEQAVRSVIERIVYPLGRRIDEASPMVDARLPDGSRLNAVLSPVSVKGASFTIRKFPKKRLQMADLVAQRSLPATLAEFLHLCVDRRLNILVSGGTGSGKTTLLNILAGYVDPKQRIVTIEDSAELFIEHPHVVTLEARSANSEGQGAVTIRDLVKNALRMRPDRIVIGEVRSAEALDMLAAMNTGHEGSITTLHANSPRDALSRLETMVLSANVALPLQAIREQIGSAIQLVVQQTRMANGRRVITGLAEVSGMESGVIRTQQLAQFDLRSEQIRSTGLRPAIFEQLNIQVDRTMLNWFVQS